MAFWIFKCNPNVYQLDERLADPNPTITWTVSQHRDEIGVGDIAFLWKTGHDRGIRAVMRVDQAPRQMSELKTEQPYWVRSDHETKWRVIGILVDRDVDLSAAMLREVGGLENLPVFHGFQQLTNFPVTAEEGAILLRLIEGHTG